MAEVDMMDTCMDSAEAAAELPEESMMMISSEMSMIEGLELTRADSMVVEGVGGGGVTGFVVLELEATPGAGAESESL